MYVRLNNPSRNINNDYNNKDMEAYSNTEVSELKAKAKKIIKKLKDEIKKLKDEKYDLKRIINEKDNTIERLEQIISRFHFTEDENSEKGFPEEQNEIGRTQKVLDNSSLKKISPKIKEITQDNNTVETTTENSINIHSGSLSRKKKPLKKVVQTQNIVKTKMPTANIKKIYFSMPENDGRFIVDNGVLSNDGRKYYRLEYIEGSETGDLYFIPGDRDKRAINRLESYLKPACDIENIENADSATNIEFKNPGKVSLRNDSWVIDSDNKVQIKLY